MFTFARMAESIVIKEGLSKEEKYSSLLPQLIALIEGEDDLIANTANIIAALKETFSFFWIGIYFVKKISGKETLILGPFQGPPACVRIEKGRGVCGTSWQKKESIIVPDVELFPGHISCSAFSRSEIVVPFFKDGEVAGVIDIDSTRVSEFDQTDRLFLEKIAGIISKMI
jgi:L-methionine (R)-S-oxide reductase